jgi:hypothetical protein
MRKLIATSMVSLDGVMQAPGGPAEVGGLQRHEGRVRMLGSC